MSIVRPISEAHCKKQARKGEGPDSARSCYLALFVGLYAFFGWTGIGATPVLYVGLIQELGVSREDASAPFTSMMCTYFLASLAYGVLSKWMGEKALLSTGAAITCGSLFAGYFVRDINLLTFFFGPIHGFGAAAVGVVPGSLIAQYFVKYRATAMGVMSVILSLTGIAFPPMAAFFMNHYGFSSTLLLLGALSLNQFACCIPLDAAPWKDQMNVGGSDDDPIASCTPDKSSSYESTPPQCFQHVHSVGAKRTCTPFNVPNVAVQTISDKVCQANGYSTAQAEIHVKGGKRKSSLSSRAQPFLRASYVHVCLSNVCSCFIVFAVTLILVDYANDNGITNYRATTLVTVVAAGWTVASVLVGPVVDGGILTKESAIFSSFFMPAMGLVLMVLLKTSYVWLLISSFLVGWGHGSRAFLLFLAVSQWFSGRHLPLAFSLMSVFCFVPFVVRTPLIGFVRDQMGCYDGLFLSLAVLAWAFTVSWGTVTFSKRRNRTAKLQISLPLAT